MAPWSNTQVQVQVPAGLPPGDTTITVQTPDGVSAPFPFTVMATPPPPPPAPVVSSVVPPTAKPGDVITINGQNFGAAQGASVVTIGGVIAQVV